jgi:hypothetical protein
MTRKPILRGLPIARDNAPAPGASATFPCRYSPGNLPAAEGTPGVDNSVGHPKHLPQTSLTTPEAAARAFAFPGTRACIAFLVRRPSSMSGRRNLDLTPGAGSTGRI